MKNLYLKFAIAVAAGLLVHSATTAQLAPSARRAASVHISQGPEMERVDPKYAIITWTSNNPGGDPEHFGVVHYGTDPKNLGETAKSPNRLNPAHPDTIFRVQLLGLKPKTTYYYTVDSEEANGRSDGIKSPVKSFTTR
jgi:phosphodiesterase/alkaline phosphatase D-like protein